MNIITKFRRYRWIVTGRWRIRRKSEKAAQKNALKVILGTGHTTYEGWIATDLPHFNILKKEDWAYFFNGLEINNLMAEHVFEHLTEAQTTEVLKLAFMYLKKGATFRVAVPDGFNPDADYIEYVRPGGSGLGADDHKVLWNFKTLRKAGEDAGYKSELIEYFNDSNHLVENHLDDSKGYIVRCRKRVDNPMAYHSLIIDFVK